MMATDVVSKVGLNPITEVLIVGRRHKTVVIAVHLGDLLLVAGGALITFNVLRHRVKRLP